MVYKEFQERFTSILQQKLGDNCRLILQKVPKNNGILLDGLSILIPGRPAAPTVYLNYYYERYLEGVPMEHLAEEIRDLCAQNPDILRVDFAGLKDFKEIKDRIVFRLINTRSNRALLSDVPSVPYLDLSIVFFLFLDQGNQGQLTAQIHTRHMKMWNVTAEELYELAMKNTPRLLPPFICDMHHVLQDLLLEQLGGSCQEELPKQLCPDPEAPPMYVLSNTSGACGAAAALYPGELKNFANTLDRDLVILPSSIHEVLLIPYTADIVFSDLTAMVSAINRFEVAREDRLSDHVYFYSREADEMIIAHDSATEYVS